MSDLLDSRDHRPYPPPGGAWCMTQTWEKLLFMHWPVSVESLARQIPEPLEVDVFSGPNNNDCGWIAVVPFRMTGVRFRYAPALPYLSSFLELNVRTYVRYREKTGVYFFSLDASNAVAVETARAWFKLPYFNADMSLHDRDGFVDYRSTRTDGRSPVCELKTRYKPVGPPQQVEAGSLEEFLVERYRLLLEDRGTVICGEIHHPPWQLQIAEAEIETNSMLSSLDLEIDGNPLLHYASSIRTLEWPPRRET